MLKHGGDALGIFKRSHWFHCTHDQNMRKKDPRKSLEEKGPSTLCAAKTMIVGRKLTGCACRTSTKKNSLTMATIFEGVTCDCVVDANSKNKNNKNELNDDNAKKSHAFRLFRKGKCSDDSKEQLAFDALKNVPMRHVTERQGSSEWFKCRAFSFTSSGVDVQFTLKFRNNIENNSVNNSRHWEVIKRYIYACKAHDENNDLENEEEDDENNAEIENDDLLNDITNENKRSSNNNVDGSHFYEGTIENIVNEEINNVTESNLNPNTNHDELSDYEGMCNDLKDDTDRSRDHRLNIINEIDEGQHKDLIVCLLNKIIGKLFTTPSTNKKHIIKWLEATQSRQPYVLLKKNKLQVCCTVNAVASLVFFN